MKNLFEKPISPERAAELFKEMRDKANEEPEAANSEPVKPKLRTGASAMHEWEEEKERREDEKKAA